LQLSWLQQQVAQLPDRSPDGFAHQDVTGGHAWAGIERVSFDPACQSARRVNPAEGSARTAAEPPRIPASAGALVWDRKGRLLILKPTYKSGWTIPGGEVEADGETPWEACRRETHEECGLDLRNGRLVCVDFLRPRPGRPGGMRFLFDCGVLGKPVLAGIVLQEEEISEYRLAPVDRALRLLSGPVRRRIAVAVKKPRRLHYLEDGRPV